MSVYQMTPRTPARGNMIQRPRIEQLLEDGIKYPELVVSAGAGFGKTQAVLSFLEHAPHRGVWLQLTQLDNMPSRFWVSYTRTVSLHRKELSEKLLKLGFPDTLYKMDRFLHLITGELYVDNQFVIFVFDDFQLIRDESVRRFFRLFIEANMENICIVRITREIETNTLNNSAFTIGTDELRFDREESIRYFKQQKIPYMPEHDLNKLYAYTGGWPMALYLVGLQLKNNKLQWKERLINSQQMIFELIETEIFSAYSEKEREFFVLLSILHFFPKELLKAFAKGSLDEVDKLMKKNVFIVFDPKANNYYPHQVFLDFLSGMQYTISATSKEKMLYEAACWCRDNAYRVDAVDYFFRCGEYEQIWQMIECLEGTRYSKDVADYYIERIEKMPECLLFENPMRRIKYAMLLLNNMELEKAEQQMAVVYRGLAENEKACDGAADIEKIRRLLGEAFAASGLISFGKENLEFVRYFREADKRLPGGSNWLNSNLRLVEYSNALNLRSAGRGELEASLNAFAEGMPYVSRVLNGAGYGLECLAGAEASFLTGEIKRAQKDAFQAIYMAREKQQSDIEDNALFLLLRIYLVNGEIKLLKGVLDQLKEKAGGGEPDTQSVADIALGWFFSEIGMLSAIARWIRDVGDGSQTPISMDKEMLVRVRCLIAERRYFEALAALNRLEEHYRKKNSLISLIYTYVYRAIAYYKADDKEQAVQSVRDAYTLSNENNLIMPFVEYGQYTRAILSHIQQSGCCPDLPEKWLNTVNTKAATYAKRKAFIAAKFKDIYGVNVPEHNLTEREAELLKNLSQGFKREEIAESMFISPHTVKSMLKTVYNKIGAINSADAIRISSNIGLI